MAPRPPELSLWSAEALSDRPLPLPGQLMPRGWRGQVSVDGVAVRFGQAWQSLSSAVAHGGWGQTHGFINMHLRGDCPLDATPAETLLARRIKKSGLACDAVGMMTAAAMRSFRLASVEIDGIRLSVLVTAGLANARRAGDAADEPRSAPAPLGTINLALGTSAALTPAAMAETLTTLTEAKAATLQDMDVTSPVSGALATGTGTDATAVFCALLGEPLRYTGKHTRFGEQAARLVIAALADSIRLDVRVGPAHAG